MVHKGGRHVLLEGLSNRLPRAAAFTSNCSFIKATSNAIAAASARIPGRDNPQPHGTDSRRKALILAAYHERMSMRGLARTFGVSRSTVTAWLKKASRLPPLNQMLVLAQTRYVLELDEIWSLVGFRKNKRWIWLAQCRRTRQIVAYAICGYEVMAT